MRMHTCHVEDRSDGASTTHMKPTGCFAMEVDFRAFSSLLCVAVIKESSVHELDPGCVDSFMVRWILEKVSAHNFFWIIVHIEVHSIALSCSTHHGNSLLPTLIKLKPVSVANIINTNVGIVGRIVISAHPFRGYGRPRGLRSHP